MKWTGPCSFCGAPVQLAQEPPSSAKVRCPRCRKDADTKRVGAGMEGILGRLVDMVNRTRGGRP